MKKEAEFRNTLISEVILIICKRGKVILPL